ncbi:MAG: TIGR03016 family PEP-CTERM system-associated outer membrane protein [Gammaproteobacteria bacterium]|nr:TIGR03016 family PEP-CTERM system-associated outer membrane protein [Gammaproteobacteria bacterium]MDH5799213.1 TIGR03016 family PEP-CTERM system-associated outer membrane protein [Gammaproteobacteria bacterium]
MINARKKFGTEFLGVKLRVFFLSLVGLSWANSLHAVQWQFTPTMEAALAYTDNVSLSATSEQSEVILELNPGFTMRGEGAHTKLSLQYGLEAFYYNEMSEQNGTYQQMDLSLDQDIFTDNLVLSVAGSYQQQNIDARENAPSSNMFVTGNRTDMQSYYVAPTYRVPQTDTPGVMIRPSYGAVRYDETPDFNARVTQLLVVVNQTPNVRTLAWNVSAQKRTVRYRNQDELNLERLDYGLDLPLGTQVVLKATAGKEENRYFYQNIESISTGGTWRAGLRWEPAGRTSVELGSGERSFGKTYDFELNHGSKYSTWRLGYNEDVETLSLQLQPVSGVDSEGGVDVPLPSEGIQGVGNEVFIAKRVSGSVTYSKAKSDYNLSLLQEKREYEIVQRSETYTNFDADFSWSMSSRSELKTGIGLRRSSASNDSRVDSLREFTILFSNRTSRKISTSLKYTHASNNSTSDILDYRYNLVALEIAAKF